MPATVRERRWRELISRLRHGPPPRGEQFDLCRRVAAAAPGTAEAEAALRMLLEGAMADASTPIDDAQEIMLLLKAADAGTLRLGDLLAAP